MIIGGSTGFRMMIALPRCGAADRLDGVRGGLGELVDVGAGARAGRARRDRGDDLRVRHRGDPRDRVHDRDRRLAAAGDHVDVRRVGVLVAGSPRGQTNGPMAAGVRSIGGDAGLGVARRRWPGAPSPRWPRRPGRAARPARSSQSTPSALRLDAELAGAGQAVGRRVDADHVARRRCASLRCSLTSRSVPMLPGPTMAAVGLAAGRPGARGWRWCWSLDLLSSGRASGSGSERCASRIDAEGVRRWYRPAGESNGDCSGRCTVPTSAPSSTHAYR